MHAVFWLNMYHFSTNHHCKTFLPSLALASKTMTKTTTTRMLTRVRLFNSAMCSWVAVSLAEGAELPEQLAPGWVCSSVLNKAWAVGVACTAAEVNREVVEGEEAG